MEWKPLGCLGNVWDALDTHKKTSFFRTLTRRHSNWYTFSHKKTSFVEVLTRRSSWTQQLVHVFANICHFSRFLPAGGSRTQQHLA